MSRGTLSAGTVRMRPCDFSVYGNRMSTFERGYAEMLVEREFRAIPRLSTVPVG